jgi:uncharacterized protein (TIGR02285 family)
MLKRGTLLGTLLIIVGGVLAFAFLWFDSRESEKREENPPREFAIKEKEISEEGEESEGREESEEKAARVRLRWLSLTGLEPMFFSTGPMKGMGWVENYTDAIRSAMEANGIEVDMDYTTAARVEYELGLDGPICHFPFNLRRPEKYFKTESKSKLIHSYPLWLDGDKTAHIVIRKGERGRFEKHLRENGDLDLESVVRDPRLKTLLIRDRDYGPIGDMLTRRAEDGEQQLQADFQHVHLMVASSNIQVIQMLSAKRFDYAIAESINPTDLAKAGLDKEQFEYLSYKTAAITSPEDPRLIWKTIACTDTKITRQAVKIANQLISGMHYTIRKGLHYYRKKLSQNKNLSAFNLELGQKLSLSSGEPYWYKLQSTKELSPNASLKLPPLNSVRPAISRNGIEWYQYRINKRLLLANHLGLLNAQGQYEKINVGRVSTYSFGYREFWPLMPEQLRADINQINIALPGKKNFQQLVPSNGDNGGGDVKKVEEVTILAETLVASDAKHLVKLLSGQKIRKLRIIGGGIGFMQALIPLLPKNLEALNLLGCALPDAKLATLISPKLVQLQLIDIVLNRGELLKVFQALPAGLEELSVASLRGIWRPDMVEVLAAKDFPKLKVFRLYRERLPPKQLATLAKRFIKTGVELLWFDRFYPALISHLRGVFPATLREIRFRASRLGPELKFGKALKSFSLELSSFDSIGVHFDGKLSTFRFYPHLTSEEAALGLRSMANKLSTQMETLDLEKSQISAKALGQFLDKSKLKSVREVNLSGTDTNDTILEKLHGMGLRPQALLLGNAKITGQGLKSITNWWGKTLVKLDVSDNFLQGRDIEAFCRGASDRLKRLSLNGAVKLKLSHILPCLRPSLRQLSLDGTYLSARDMVKLAAAASQFAINLVLPQWYTYTQFNKAFYSSLGMASTLTMTLDYNPKTSGDDFPDLSGKGGYRFINLTLGEMTPTQAKGLALKLPKVSRFLWVQAENRSADTNRAFCENISPHILRLSWESAKVDVCEVLFKRSQNLRGLEYDHRGLGGEGRGETRPLNLPKTIQTLQLWDTKTGPSIIEKILASELPALYWIMIHNYQGDLRKILTNGPGLQTLRVELNQPLPQDTDQLPWPTNLKDIRFDRSKLTARQLMRILKTLPPDLVSLWLTSTQLSYTDIPELLTHIFPKFHGPFGGLLRHNNFGDRGRRQLSEYARERRRAGDEFWLTL